MATVNEAGTVTCTVGQRPRLFSFYSESVLPELTPPNRNREAREAWADILRPRCSVSHALPQELNATLTTQPNHDFHAMPNLKKQTPIIDNSNAGVKPIH